MIPAHHLVPTADLPDIPAIDPGTPYVSTWHDGTVTLYLDPRKYDFHMDSSPSAEPATRHAYTRLAERMGFEVMHEDECPAELLDNGMVRVYLVPIESFSEEEWAMPSLVETGFGPFSMEIPVVNSRVVQERDEFHETFRVVVPEEVVPIDYQEMQTGPLTSFGGLPPLPYKPPPITDRYEQTFFGQRKIGRHRKP